MISANPRCKFNWGSFDGELAAEGDAALGVELAKVGGDGVPEDGLDDGVATSGFLLDSGFGASIGVQNGEKRNSC